jgi:hypothetical protein
MIDRPTDPRPGREDEIRQRWARGIEVYWGDSAQAHADVAYLLDALAAGRQEGEPDARRHGFLDGIHSAAELALQPFETPAELVEAILGLAERAALAGKPPPERENGRPDD